MSQYTNEAATLLFFCKSYLISSASACSPDAKEGDCQRYVPVLYSLMPPSTGYHPPLRDRPSAAGFTLIEVLVSLSILAIAMVAVLQAALSAQDAFIASQERERCAMLAELKLTQIKILGIDNTSAQGQGAFQNYPGYIWAVRVRPTRIERLTEVVVTVHAAEDTRRSRGVTLREIIYRQSPDGI